MESLSMNNLVVVDGHCTLCHHAVKLVMKHDGKGVFHFMAGQSPEAKEIFDAINWKEGKSLPESVIYVEDGRMYTKSTAALRIARKMDRPWPLFYVLRFVPISIRDFFYDLIAKHRYRLFGRKDHCSLPLVK